ncbi:MAG: arginine N-succinyltransferase [Planctomycetota bacterium]|nr:arginine N-succinyltransferase [Planctomycetota bacterium]
MLVMRPVQLDDLDAILELTRFTGFGLTTLPNDRDLLLRRIREAVRGFDTMDEAGEPRGESYLFVMEDLHTGRVVGTSGVVSKVGGFEPFYAYRVETSVVESAQLNVRKEVRTLHLVRDHNGPSEIGSLFLHPDYRKGGNGWLLSLSRFLFMAENKSFFDPQVIAEMRGVLDEKGGSVFWDAIGRHFFEIDYPKADYLSVVSKRFIADLMPVHPIYVALLPPGAQAVVGQVHEQTRPALKMLQEEGLKFREMVDIFEGGPIVGCPLAEVRTVRESVRATVAEIVEQLPAGAAGAGGSTKEAAPGPAPHLIATVRRRMVACRAPLERTADGGVRIASATALALKIRVGDVVRFIAPRPREPRPAGAAPALASTPART